MTNSNVQLILIDDDTLVRNMWELAAASRNLSIVTFKKVANLLNHSKLANINKQTNIYIDYELNDPQYENGLQAAEHLYDLGFTNIFITTGYPGDEIEKAAQKHTFIRGIIDKTPPWIVDCR